MHMYNGGWKMDGCERRVDGGWTGVWTKMESCNRSDGGTAVWKMDDTRIGILMEDNIRGGLIIGTLKLGKEMDIIKQIYIYIRINKQIK